MPSKPKKPLTLGEWADRRVCWLLSGIYDGLARDFGMQRELWRWTPSWKSYARRPGPLDKPERPREEDFPPE